MSILSKVEMCNLALSSIGLSELIQSLDDDTTPARQCKLLFKPSAIELLTLYNWSFAERKQYLALLDSVEPVDYRYAYSYPSNCLRFRGIYSSLSSSEPIPYGIQLSEDGKGRYVITDQPTAIGIFTVDVSDDTGAWSEFFSSAFVWKLASKLVTPLTRNSGLIKTIIQLAQINIAEMVSLDCNEDYEPVEGYNEFVEVRK